MKSYNLEGKKYGNLLAIRMVGEDSNNHSKIWECKCDCGNTTRVRCTQLINGKIISCRACGYLRAPRTRAFNDDFRTILSGAA